MNAKNLFNKRKLLVLILALLTLAVYANAMQGKFVWDDQTIVLRNPAVKSFGNIPYVFTNEFAEMAKYNGNVYRPMQEVSYMADYFLWGWDPAGFHITSILLQIACAILLFYIVLGISGSQAVAFISALIFGVHPINTEAVTYISGRSDPLFFTFLLAAFLLYMKLAEVKKAKFVILYVLSLLFYILSLCSRETALVFPLILVAYEIYARKAKIDIKKFIPYIAIVILYILFRLNFIELETTKLRPSPIGVTVLTDVKIIFEYLRLLVFPFALHMERRLPFSVRIDEQVILSATVIIPIFVFMFRLKDKRKDVFFWFLWFAIFLLPHLNFMRLNANIAEHWIYSASVGFYVILAIFLNGMIEKGGVLKKTAYAVFAVIVIYLSSLTIMRNSDWRDEPSIYRNTLSYTKSARVYSNLGVHYDIAKDYDKALLAYTEALKIVPNEPLYHNNIALIYLKKGDVKKARLHWQKSLGINPNQPQIAEFLKKYGG